MKPFKREYDYFLLLCETLNISKAAEEAGIQQAGLSKSLKVLEDNFEQPLFHRTNRGLKLTRLGKELRKILLETKNSWDERLEKSLGKSDKVAGRFKIGAHPTVAINFLPRFFPQLCEKHPGLNLDLVLDRSAHITDQIINFDIDFGIVANPKAHPDLVIIPLRREYVALWGKDLSEVLYYNPEMLGVTKILKKYKSHKKIPINDYEVLASFASTTKGVVLLPSPVADRNTRLKQVAPPILDAKICLIYRHDLLKGKAFKTILSAIKNCVS